MNTYSIARIGSEYVVLADDKRILKVASRRKAAKLVVDAAELLSEQSACGQDRPSHQSPVNSGSHLIPAGSHPIPARQT